MDEEDTLAIVYYQSSSISSFQNDRNLYIPGPSLKKILKVYCVCRLPDNGDDNMIFCNVCKEWFHYTCVNISKAPPGPYTCCGCSF